MTGTRQMLGVVTDDARVRWQLGEYLDLVQADEMMRTSTGRKGHCGYANGSAPR